MGHKRFNSLFGIRKFCPVIFMHQFIQLTGDFRLKTDKTEMCTETVAVMCTLNF